LPITYTSSNPAVATINSNVATFTGVGSTTITANQNGNASYYTATPVSQTLTINQGIQTITFNPLASATLGDPSFNLNATASSGLPISYTSSNTAVATVSGNSVTIVGAGTANITASQAGNSNWTLATSVIQPLVVKSPQTISFGPLTNKNFGDAPFSLSATASSGLTVSYTSSDITVATISGGTVTIIGPGSTTITASQSGNSSYNPAPGVQQTLVVGLLAPTVSSSFIEFTNVTDTQMNIGVIPGNGNKRLIVIKPSSPSSFFVPVNNVLYSAGYTNNGSMVVMSGTSSIATVTGLTANTKYYVEVFEFNEGNSQAMYLTGCVPNAAQQTSSSGSGARLVSSQTTETISKSELPINEFDVKILGNPFGKKLSFQVQSKNQDALVTLVDLTGKVMHESLVKTNTTIEIEKPLSQGIYLLKVKDANNSKTIRVVKIE
jgi:hypothetical protein